MDEKPPEFFSAGSPSAPPPADGQLGETAGPRLRLAGKFTKCRACDGIVYKEQLKDNFYICPKCGTPFRLGAETWISLLCDPGSFRETEAHLRPSDPLGFRDVQPYAERLRQAQRASGLTEAAVIGTAKIGGYPVVFGALEFGFLGGSMGSVVGEKVRRAAEQALRLRRPLLLVSSSGGARMQEGILSLMQMAKTSAAIGRLSRAGLPYLSLLADPTTGGVTASFAMLGDIHIAEPKALIGFAGPRVIEQTIRQKLPEGFQRAEFLLEHGMVDLVVERGRMKETVVRLLRFFLTPAVPQKRRTSGRWTKEK